MQTNSQHDQEIPNALHSRLGENTAKELCILLPFRGCGEAAAVLVCGRGIKKLIS